MKSKRLVSIVLFYTLMLSANAQEKNMTLMDVRIGHDFAAKLSSVVDFEASAMRCLGTTRWMVGGVLKFANFSSSEKEAADFPLDGFRISTTRYGIGPVVRYNLPVDCGYQSLSFKAIVSKNNIKMTARDERYVGYDSDNDVTNTFELKCADGNNPECLFLLTLELMYTIDIVDGISLGLTFGCDITHYIKDSFRQKTVTLTSNEWDEFEKYNGTPTLNIFEETATGQKMSSPVVFYFGISFGFGGVL